MPIVTLETWLINLSTRIQSGKLPLHEADVLKGNFYLKCFNVMYI